MVYSADDAFAAAWTREHVEAIRLEPSLMAPAIDRGFPVMSDAVWAWDTWPLTDLDMRPVSFDGWHLIFSLVAPRRLGFHDRHPVASIGWFASRDGRTWRYRGAALPPASALGTRQWAGCAVLAGDRVHLFYTASGDGRTAHDPDWLINDPLQRIALATATITSEAGDVAFKGAAFADSRVVAEADGQLYQTPEQAHGGEIIYAFRDPFVFTEDNQIYMTLSGNTAGPGCFTGNVGLARARDGQLDHWELLPPLMHANGVNQQMERPHFVIHDGRHYLFVISHIETYAPGLAGPDGLYGFVGDGLRSDYRPLNESGLVIGNDPSRPPERYSDYVMPNWLVEGFVDTVDDRPGGTLAPTLRLEVDGARTRVAEQLDYGLVPAMAAREPTHARP